MVKMNLTAVILLCLVFLAVDLVGLSSATCSSDFTDVSSCTLQSDIVFEGHAVSPASQTTVPHQVTFQVKKLHKGTLEQNDKKKFLPISVGIFGERENLSECISGPVKPKTKYLVFLKNKNVTSANGGSYRITCSAPVPANKKNSKDASSSACATCGQKPTVKLSPAKEVKVAIGRSAQVSCNHQGKPPPKITWSKNGKPLISGGRIQLKSAKRSSKLIIKKVTADDQGLYECQAVNVLGSSPKIGVRITPTATTTPPTSHKTLCQDQRMCFNNGTCYELIQLGKKFCSCLDDFKGNRCQEKISPWTARSTAVTSSFLFVLVVGASVAGFVLLTAALVALFASLRKHRMVRKLGRQGKNSIFRHQYPNDPTEEAVARGRHVNRQDVSMQTESLQSAKEASSLGGKRLPGSAPLPNGKLSGSPHVSSSSSGTSPSEIDSGEYFVGHQSNRGSSMGATHQSKPKTTTSRGEDKRSSRKSNQEPPMEMKPLVSTKTKELLEQKTTIV